MLAASAVAVLACEPSSTVSPELTADAVHKISCFSELLNELAKVEPKAAIDLRESVSKGIPLTEDQRALLLRLCDRAGEATTCVRK